MLPRVGGELGGLFAGTVERRGKAAPEMVAGGEQAAELVLFGGRAAIAAEGVELGDALVARLEL